MRITRLLCLLLMLGSATAFAQSVSFTRISPPVNYPFTLISGMAQDTLGYMWFISGGILYRYDGYEFKTYKNDPLDTLSLAAGNLESIYIDSKGIIWLGDQYMGLHSFDPGKGIFRRHRYDSSNKPADYNERVAVINEDNAGNLWIGTRDGLYILERKTNHFKHYKNEPADPSSLSHSDINAIYKDHSGTMWVGTGGAFYTKVMDMRGGLNRFDANTGKFTRFVHDDKNPQSIGDNRVKSIFEDSRGVFWVGTAGKDGLYTLDRKTGKFTRYRYDPAYPEKLSRPPQKRTVPYADDHITFIKEDVRGFIWIGTFEGGLSRYDPKKEIVTRFSSANDPDSLHENGMWSMYSSRDGMLWMGTWEMGLFNLYKIDPLAVSLNHDYLGISHTSFYEDNAGNLYAGGFGLALLNKDLKIVKQYLNNNNDSGTNVLSDNFTLSIEGDRNGIIWLGTEKGGLNSFDPRTGQFRNYQNDPANKNSISSGPIFGILEDSKNRLWICSIGGLNIMNTQKGTFSHFYSDSNNINTLSSELTTKIIETCAHEIWVGTVKGINRYNEDTKGFRQYLTDRVIFFIYEDSENTLWVGTDKGLFYLKKGFDKFGEYVDTDHQIEQSVITSIIEDNQKNLWLTNYLGIKILNPTRTGSISYLLKNNWNFNITPYMPVHKMKSGNLIYGNASGIFQIVPEQFPKNTIAPQLVITSIKILDKEISESYDLKEISLDHHQNTFSFTFAGIQFSKPEENRHLYKLEGYDDKWRTAGSERTASFYNVPPGTYNLTLTACNSNGKWTEKTIKIIISPPWWNTLWFRAIAVAGILGIFYGIIRWRMQQQFALKLERSEQEKQLADLKHKTSELEINALRAQMNPHFIFNSLNSINRFILQNNKSQASEYLTKFSKLVRQIFHNSQAALVTLDNELDALKLYLELEAVRFDNQFEYQVNVDEDIDTSALKVPPLIIQPYAENAIWHGLMHKEEKGHLLIDISLNGNTVICRIKDDGIGRKRSSEMKSKSNNTHKSMGMRITADRITLLQEQKLIQTSVDIIDLILPDGSPGGTEIIIKLPVRYD